MDWIHPNAAEKLNRSYILWPGYRKRKKIFYVGLCSKKINFFCEHHEKNARQGISADKFLQKHFDRLNVSFMGDVMIPEAALLVLQCRESLAVYD